MASPRARRTRRALLAPATPPSLQELALLAALACGILIIADAGSLALPAAIPVAFPAAAKPQKNASQWASVSLPPSEAATAKGGAFERFPAAFVSVSAPLLPPAIATGTAAATAAAPVPLRSRQMGFKYAAPLLVDLDGDGHLDLLDAMHGYATHLPCEGASSLQVAETLRVLVDVDGLMSNKTELEALLAAASSAGVPPGWDVVLRRGGAFAAAAAGTVELHFEPADIDILAANEVRADFHGAAMADLDGDGLPDLIVHTGGGSGVGVGSRFDSFLLWGNETTSTASGATNAPGFRLVGGRPAARAAGLTCRDCRGRAALVFDANADGLLDVVLLNDARKDVLHAPSRLYLNAGKRAFAPHGDAWGALATADAARVGLAEYSPLALLADVDGDGVALELLVPRRKCWLLEHEAPDPARAAFCAARPMGSIGVYAYEAASGTFGLLAEAESLGGGKAAVGLAALDFDGDAKSDVAVLLGSGDIALYGSVDRGGGSNLTVSGAPSGYVDRSGYGGVACKRAKVLRAADLDLDGLEELVVVCGAPSADGKPRHEVYEQYLDVAAGAYAWRRPLDFAGDPISLGDLRSAKGTFHKSFCAGVPTTGELSVHRVTPSCKDTFGAKACSNVCGGQGHYRACLDMEYYMQAQGAFAPEGTGLAVGDLDNDGYPDLAIAHKAGSTLFLRNRWALRHAAESQPRRFLALRLAGPAAVRIGATVRLLAANMTVKTSLGPRIGQTLTLLRVDPARGGGSPDGRGGGDERVVFGLGASGQPRRLEVTWPSGEPSVLEGDTLAGALNVMGDGILVVQAPYTSGPVGDR